MAQKNKNIENYIDLLVEETVADIVFNPLKTIVQTAKATGTHIVASTANLVKGILYQIPTLIVPRMKFHYDQFMKDQERKLAEIEKRYGSVYKQVMDAMKNRDMWGFLFFLQPEIMLGQKLLMAAPSVGLSALEVLTGGDPSIVSLANQYSAATQALPRPTDPNAGWHSGGGGGYDSYGDYGDYGLYESIINEDATTSILSNPVIMQKLSGNQFIKDVKNIGASMWINQIKELDNVNSLDDQKLKQVFGDSIDKIKNEIKTSLDKDQKLKANKQEYDAAYNTAEKSALEQIKKTNKDFYHKQLEQIAAQNPGTKTMVNYIINSTK